MKITQVFLFFAVVLALLAVMWRFYPAGGVEAFGRTWRFPSYADAALAEEPAVDVDSVLAALNASTDMQYSSSLQDSVHFFREYLTSHPARIALPDDDLTYFDLVFNSFENAVTSGKVYRVMHYGDSQIELDRISSVLRQRLQERFGGSGPGMIPPVQQVPSISVVQRAWNLPLYAVYGDSTTHRARHRRYGVMTRFAPVRDTASVTFSQTNNSHAFDGVKTISRVSVLLAPDSTGVSVGLGTAVLRRTDTLSGHGEVVLRTWELPAPVRRGTLTFRGKADIYGVMLDGAPGVTVDNVPLRGCSGTIFTAIDPSSMRQAFELLDVRMILLQFGGNRMPSLNKSSDISAYMREMVRQIAYFRSVAPHAALLFIGPADMARSYDGQLSTWKGLVALNDSLRSTMLHHGVAYWDMFRVMGGEESMVQYVNHAPPLAGPDYIHFTHQGAQEIGAALAASLDMCYEFYCLRKKWRDTDLFDWMRRPDAVSPDTLTDTQTDTFRTPFPILPEVDVQVINETSDML